MEAILCDEERINEIIVTLLHFLHNYYSNNVAISVDCAHYVFESPPSVEQRLCKEIFMFQLIASNLVEKNLDLFVELLNIKDKENFKTWQRLMRKTIKIFYNYHNTPEWASKCMELYSMALGPEALLFGAESRRLQKLQQEQEQNEGSGSVYSNMP